MKRVIYHCIHGFTNLKEYGYHPGVGMASTLILAIAFAGVAKGGLIGFIFGLLLGAVFILPMLLVGSYGRSKDHEKYHGS